MQFQQDLPKDKKLQLFNFWPENLEKLHSTELYGAPLDGSAIFLYPSSTSRTPLNSSRLAELKYAFFSRTRCNTKKLRRSNLFPLTIFKHGLLKGSIILFRYNYTSRSSLESSRLGQLNYAISAREGVGSKYNSFCKGKIQ